MFLCDLFRFEIFFRKNTILKKKNCAKVHTMIGLTMFSNEKSRLIRKSNELYMRSINYVDSINSHVLNLWNHFEMPSISLSIQTLGKIDKTIY